MMETLVHTAEGDLRSLDPFRIVGSRGYYTLDRRYKFYISPRAAEYNKGVIENERVIVCWWDYPNLRWQEEKEVRLVEWNCHLRDNLEIIEKDSPRYFSIPGE